MAWNARQMIFGKRDAVPAPQRGFVGFPTDGGILPGGVTGTTALGISSVFRCLDILSNGVSQLPWYEKRGTLELPPKAQSAIVKRPQSQRTRREWCSIVVSTLALYDVAYLLKADRDAEGYPRSLLYLQPAIVTPKLYDQYNILPPTQYYVLGEEVDAEEIVVLHRSPQPGIWDSQGGVINLARATFAAAIAAENYSSRYWQGGGSPTGYLTTDANLSDPVAVQLGDRWAEKRRAGPDHPPVLSGGLKYMDSGIDPTAASAVEARKEMVADIGRYFGIPTLLLNAPAGDSETYGTSEGQALGLVTYTLQNYINAIEDAITDNLPGGRYLQIEVDPLRRGTQYSRAQSWQLATAGKAWMTPDEVREEEGLPPAERPDLLNPPAPTPVVNAAAASLSPNTGG